MKQQVPMKWVLAGALAIAVVIGLFVVIRGGNEPKAPKEAGFASDGTKPADPGTNVPYAPGEGPKTIN